MDVRIGVTQSPREIEVELGDDAVADWLAEQLGEALTSDGGIFWLTDRKGRRIGVPAAKVAYVEIGSPTEERRVGVPAAKVAYLEIGSPTEERRVGFGAHTVT